MLNTRVQQYVYWQNKDKFLLSKDIDAYWIMYIIDRGMCQYQIESFEGVARPGDILICPPYTTFEREALTPLTFHFFRFTLKNDLIDEKKLMGPFYIGEKKRVTSTASMLKAIQYDDSPQVKSFRNHLLDDILFLKFYENSTIINTSQDTIKDDVIKGAVVYLADISSTSLSVTDIAQALNINPCHFSRKFKQIMAVTPIEYRNKIRLKEAQKLLIETDYSIETIAERCGYGNAFYFSRIFAKFMGEAPSSYRNNHKI